MMPNNPYSDLTFESHSITHLTIETPNGEKQYKSLKKDLISHLTFESPAFYRFRFWNSELGFETPALYRFDF